ncbi:23S rRNA (uracil(1939)-C(5))-methyltransferase RlmD [Marinimicrobium sp. C2-29]|uniref:23S rRNA (uracil(1939)-C(5))-methyltransferase RlmD n=1 Tax=Marinimicrobium sp. C2-29 TaxID=3139825 RepID=UPI00313A27D9
MSRRPRGGRSRPGSRPRAAPFTARDLPGLFEIERLSHDGRGIARWEGKTLFVEGALPQEQVRVRLLGNQSRYAEGEALEYHNAASDRQTPPCRHYHECGGCQLQHLTPEAQLQAKQTSLLEQLQRTARLQPGHLVAPIASDSEGYRHRARLGVWYERSGEVILGFRRKRRRELTPIDHCTVLAPELNRLLAPLKQWLTTLETRGAITHVEAMTGAPGPALVLREVKPLSPADQDRLRQLEAGQGCVVWRQPGAASALLDSSGRPVDPRLSYCLPADLSGELNGELPEEALTLASHPGDFTQVNPSVNRRMVQQAMDWLAVGPGETVLDLFCGIGNFTLPLARRGAQVLGLEGSQAMVERARDNARANGLTEARFEAADLNNTDLKRFKRSLGRVDALLLDPPRDGARELIRGVGQLSPSRVVYVSCNPATLARDAAELAAAGYHLQSLGVLDMFPHTEHMESMALFIRR